MFSSFLRLPPSRQYRLSRQCAALLGRTFPDALANPGSCGGQTAEAAERDGGGVLAFLLRPSSIRK